MYIGLQKKYYFTNILRRTRYLILNITSNLDRVEFISIRWKLLAFCAMNNIHYTHFHICGKLHLSYTMSLKHRNSDYAVIISYTLCDVTSDSAEPVNIT